jgi:hypothetical protein
VYRGPNDKRSTAQPVILPGLYPAQRLYPRNPIYLAEGGNASTSTFVRLSKVNGRDFSSVSLSLVSCAGRDVAVGECAGAWALCDGGKWGLMKHTCSRLFAGLREVLISNFKLVFLAINI